MIEFAAITQPKTVVISRNISISLFYHLLHTVSSILEREWTACTTSSYFASSCSVPSILFLLAELGKWVSPLL